MNKGPLLRVITAHLQAHPRSLWQTKHDTLPPRRTRVERKDWSASSRMANKPQRRIKSSGRSMHGADFSTLPSGPQLFNMCWAEQQHFVRFFGLIFLKSIAKIAAVCIDLSKTELSLQYRALFGDSCGQNWFQWIRFTESLPTENKRFFYHQKQKGFLFQIPFNILQTSRECLVLSPITWNIGVSSK